MPAKLVVMQGSRPGLEYWIEDEVVRIGSDPVCEIRILDADLPPHALTIEYLDGQFRVYNKSGRPLTLGSQPLAAAGARTWSPGSVLDCGNGYALSLETESDPTPEKRDDAPEIETDTDESEDLDDEEDETPAKPSNTMTQLLVIGVCLIVGLGLQFVDTGEPENVLTPAEVRKQFDTLIKLAITEEQSGAPGPSTIRSLLQRARIDDLRRDDQAAHEGYVRTIELIDARRDRAGGFRSDLDEEARAFALSRIKSR